MEELKMMNIVVIGLGSMGKRRIRLIRQLCPEYEIYGVDGRADRREEVDRQFGIECFMSVEEIYMCVECAFVCTPPLTHSAIICECLKRGWNVFTELNLVTDGYEENMKLAEENGCKLFLSSTFFYREEIKYIHSQIVKKNCWNYIYHIGQYLPDWHPWEEYEDFFAADKYTNGCREIMAIEFPWLVEVFGQVIGTHTLSSRQTELKISYDDNFMIQLTHENGNKGVLVVDVVSPYAVRRFEAYTEGNYISWDGTPDGLFEFCKETKELRKVQLDSRTEHMDGYASFVIEDAYKSEIRDFFEVVFKNKEPSYGLMKDREILKLIDLLGA